MNDYFDFDDRPINEDTEERFMNRSRFSLKEALEFDREMFNRILNKPTLTAADKYNLAGIFNFCAEEYEMHTDTSKSFEDFLIEANGKEWFNNMTDCWLKRQSREMAKRLDCPELANNKGMYIYKGGKKQ